MKLSTFLKHLKIQLFWNKDFDNPEKGYAILPCKRCDRLFKSYPHYNWRYDILCKKCLFLPKRKCKIDYIALIVSMVFFLCAGIGFIMTDITAFNVSIFLWAWIFLFISRH